uniref:Derlin n=1 Tax=Rhizophora mucronata TaxID=61149 RepID=A0A2P2KP98_RHIMU
MCFDIISTSIQGFSLRVYVWSKQNPFIHVLFGFSILVGGISLSNIGIIAIKLKSTLHACCAYFFTPDGQESIKVIIILFFVFLFLIMSKLV